MKQSIPISHAYESVSDYIYGLSIPDQVDIIRENLGVDVEDTDDGVVYEGSLILDSQFESMLNTILENLSDETIALIYGEMLGFETDIDGDDLVWEDDDYYTEE